MKPFVTFLLLPILACAQTEWGQVENDPQDDSVAIQRALKLTQNFICVDSLSPSHWRFMYYSLNQNRFYNVDSLVVKANRVDSLCKDITILSLEAQKYFELLQEAYLELRRLKSDSMANRMQFIAFDRRFRICK